MKTIKLNHIVLLIEMTVVSIGVMSCTKKLDVKPSQTLIVPKTAADLQGAIDADLYRNIYPSLGELGSGDFYVEDTRFATLAVDDQRIYTWAKQLYGPGRIIGDWDDNFSKLRSITAILQVLEDLKVGESSADFNNVRGSALFYRSYVNFHIAQIFAKPYNPGTASSDPGIPLLQSLDVTKPPGRASLAKTYESIISDLNSALNLLPETSIYKTRPTKLAVYAMFSRMYMAMGDYTNALQFADKALKIYSTLIDYKTLNTADSYPFKQLNAETIFYSEVTSSNSTAAGAIFYNTTSCAIEKGLYDSYTTDDIRRTAFFARQPTGLNTWKGSYSGSFILFGGLATDELYLNRAECYARAGNVPSAMEDLNTLLSKRFGAGFVPYTATDQKNAILTILKERRKELLFRGLRWMDLRRLNKEPEYAVTLTRIVNGTTYTLPPNDPRYVYPIPPDEIAISGIEQNER
ncbi:SusD family protein [compost metagenome]